MGVSAVGSLFFFLLGEAMWANDYEHDATWWEGGLGAGDRRLVKGVEEGA